MMPKEKEYCFEFPGTRAQLSERLEYFRYADRDEFSIRDYIIDDSDQRFRLGVGRGSHTGGYWFEPTVTEENGKLLLKGNIRYVDDCNNCNKSIKDSIDMIIVDIFVVPLLLIAKLFMMIYDGIRFVIRKIRKLPIPKEEDPSEVRLFYFMEEVLHCTRG